MRRFLIDLPAATVDGTVRAVLWLDAQVTWGLTLVWYAYWLVVATAAALCYVAVGLTLLAYVFELSWLLPPDPPSLPAVLPRGPRA